MAGPEYSIIRIFVRWVGIRFSILRFEYPFIFYFILFFYTWHPPRNGSQLVRLAEHLHQQQTVRQWKTFVLTYSMHIFHEKSSISYKLACACALWLVGVNAWRRACLKRGADATFQAPTEASANQIASCKYPIQFMQHQISMWLVVVTKTARQHHAPDTPSVKRWRRRARARAHTHVTHRMCVHSDHLDMVVYKR